MAAVSDSNLLRLRRFLYLGDESQIYPQSVTYPFNRNVIRCIQELMDSSLQEEAIAEIKRAYNNEHFLGFETLVYALVILGHAKNFQTRKLAMAAAKEICTTATSVLTFTHFYKEASKPSKGWGRGHRRFLVNWYNGKDAKDLAVEVTKVKTRYKWSHKDILCMAHIKAKNEALGAVFKYVVKGLEVAKRECESAEAEPVLSYLKSFYELSHSTDPIQVAGLVEVNEFCFEQIPSKIIKSKEVSLCVIPKLPLQNLLDLLPKFNKVGLLKPNSSHSTAVLERLASEETFADNSVGPLETFVAIRKWQISNQNALGKTVVKQVNPAIEDALQNLHLNSFSAVKPTEKRYLVALDIQVIMNLNKCAGCSAITPSHVSDILLMTLVKSEATVVSTLAFSEEDVVQVDINDKMSLSDVVEHLSEVPKGPAVLSSPLNWALTKKIQFDTIIVFTHRLSASQDNNLANVFKEYKETMHLPDAKFIICTLCDRTSSFPHPFYDPSYLNIVGFNPKMLKVIQDFSCSVF